MKTVVGVDLAKDSFVAMSLDAKGKPQGTAKEFKNSSKGCARFLCWLNDPSETLVIFEATGFCGKRLIKSLSGCVAGLYEVNPLILKRARLSMVQTKTDPADAAGIAKAGYSLHRTNPETLEAYRIEFDEERESLAIWLSEYRRLSRAAARLTVQMESLRQHSCSDVEAILEQRKVELEELKKRKADTKKVIEGKIATESEDSDAELLQSVPGIGPLTAAALSVVIRRIERFASADSLKAYLGAYPRRLQTGKRESQSRLAKHGNSTVRDMLWNAARSAARCNPVCRELYERMSSRNKGGPAAYGAVVRKLVQIAYGILTSRTRFRAEMA